MLRNDVLYPFVLCIVQYCSVLYDRDTTAQRHRHTETRHRDTEAQRQRDTETGRKGKEWQVGKGRNVKEGQGKEEKERKARKALWT